jgi:hypothetical protein
MAFFVGQNDRVDELNERILHRFFDNKPIQPKFTPTPESTKYVKFPVLYKTPIRLTPTETTVDIESDLYCRNDRLGGTYGSAPEARVGLRPSPLPPPLLGDEPSLKGGVVEGRGRRGTVGSLPMNVAGFSPTIGNDLFHNHTRTQLRQGVGNLR